MTDPVVDRIVDKMYGRPATPALKRMGRRDLDSALAYLRERGVEIHPAPEPEVRGRFDVTWGDGDSGWGATTERLSGRDVWFLARGMRLGAIGEV